MSVDTSAMHSPLYDPDRDGPYQGAPLDIALSLARKSLAEQGTANIHDPAAMMTAAVHLDCNLRRLVAALDEEARR